jgi:histidinol-phosphate aminotransferase
MIIARYRREGFATKKVMAEEAEPFAGKTILVTGSTRGIGFAIVKALSRYNCNLIITGKNETNVSQAVAKLEDAPCDLFSIVADLSSADGVETLYKMALEKTKRIDILINNVTFKGRKKELSTKSFSEWKQEMNVNVDSIFNLTQKVVYHMRGNRTEGKVFNISAASSKGRNSLIHSSSEILTKNLLERMTDIFAEENHLYKIGICTIRIDSGYYQDYKVDTTKVKNKMFKKVYNNINSFTAMISNDPDKIMKIFIDIMKLPIHKISGKVFSTSAYENAASAKLSNIVPSHHLLLNTNLHQKHELTKMPDENDVYVNKQNPYPLSPTISIFLKNYDYSKRNHNIKAKYPTNLARILAKNVDVDKDQIVFFKNEHEGLKKLISIFVPKYNGVISVFPIPDNLNFFAAEMKLDVKYTIYDVKKESIQPKYKHIISYVGPKTKMVYLSNPNFLTGQLLKKSDFEDFMRKLPDNIIVIIDETYIDFALTKEKDVFDSTKYLEENIIVLRSFNNFYGYENLELTYAIGSNELIRIIEESNINYNQIDKFNESLAIACLKDTKHNNKLLKRLGREKKKFYDRLTEENIKYFPTDSNYLLIETSKSRKDIKTELERNNIILEEDNSFYNSYWSVPIADAKTNDLMLDIITSKF